MSVAERPVGKRERRRPRSKGELVMAFRFTDQHAMSLVGPLLYPGEQVLFRARGVEKPWYSRIFSRIGALMWRYYLVVATNQRIVFVRHAGLLGGFGAKSNDAYAWGELDQVSLGWGIFNKTLSVRSAKKGFARNVIIPRMWMAGNFDAAKGTLDVWQQNKHALAAGPAHNVLGAAPAPSAYGTPSY
jgi:hypothetical protein